MVGNAEIQQAVADNSIDDEYWQINLALVIGGYLLTMTLHIIYAAPS